MALWLSGIGLIIGASVALYTAIFVTRHSQAREWNDSFQSLYNEFWNGADMDQARLYIVNRDNYSDLSEIIERRLKTGENTLGKKDNEALAILDRFCAVMVRVVFFKLSAANRGQRELFEASFSFWIEKMRSRDEIMAYIDAFWSPLKEAPTGEANSLHAFLNTIRFGRQ